MMKQPKHTDVLKIRISGLSNGLYEYHFSSDPVELGLRENFTSPVEVHVELDKTTGQLYLKMQIRTTGHFNCDRCVDEFEQAISCAYNMFYVYNEFETGKYESEEVQVISTDTVHLDLTEDVRQMTMLSVPLKLLCVEDCRGLCPQCGTNRNKESCSCKIEASDPRWEGLQHLLKN